MTPYDMNMMFTRYGGDQSLHEIHFHEELNGLHIESLEILNTCEPNTGSTFRDGIHFCPQTEVGFARAIKLCIGCDSNGRMIHFRAPGQRDMTCPDAQPEIF